MDINKFINKTIEEIAQDASYKFGDLVMSYPAPFRTLVLAVVQSCITANMATASETEKQIFETVCKKSTITMLPVALDPRKFGGEKNED